MRGRLTFWREFLKNHQEVGALFATGKSASVELARPTTSDKRPHRTILEVGAGDGPVTQILLKNLRAGDVLWVVELNKHLTKKLEHNLKNQIAEARSRGATVHVLCADIRKVTADQPNKSFDHIVSTLPFNGLPVELIKEVMSEYMRVLKPGGEVTYIQYIILRRIKRLFIQDKAHDEYLHDLQIKYLSAHRYVWRNLPPAHIHTLRFDQEHEPYELHHIYRLGSTLRVSTVISKYLAITVITGIILATITFVCGSEWGSSILIALCIISMAMFARFFRDNKRRIIQQKNSAYAPVDGTVVEIATVVHPELSSTQVMRVGIFMSVFDQHIIRIPTTGVITQVKQIGAGHRLAYQPDASHNAGKLLMIAPTHAPHYQMALLTGFLARRVELFFGTQTTLVQGERIGVIHFGSRVDVYLPLSYKVSDSLSVGQRVVAGHTVIAQVNEPEAY